MLELKQQEDLSILDLLKEPIILREKGSGSKKTADHFLDKIGVSENDLHIVARINDQEAIKNLVAGGLGISILSEMAARSFISEKRVLEFPLSDYQIRRNLYVIYQKNYILKPYIHAFVQFIIKKYK